jgi:hypothetical protein
MNPVEIPRNIHPSKCGAADCRIHTGEREIDEICARCGVDLPVEKIIKNKNGKMECCQECEVDLARTRKDRK